MHRNRCRFSNWSAQEKIVAIGFPGRLKRAKKKRIKGKIISTWEFGAVTARPHKSPTAEPAIRL